VLKKRTNFLQVVNTLPTEPAWAGKRVNYGKDRCAYIPKSQQAAAQAAQAVAAQSLVAQSAAVSLSPINTNVGGFGSFAPYSPFTAEGFGVPGSANRTVYLGNIHPETTTEDLCNAIRGGVLQSIRYMQDKHIAVRTINYPRNLAADLCVPVRDFYRPGSSAHFLPCGIIPRLDVEQPAAQAWLGQKRWSSSTCTRLGCTLGRDSQRVYWQH